MAAEPRTSSEVWGSRGEPLVRASAELGWFGRWWLGLGAVEFAVVAGGGWLFELERVEALVAFGTAGFASACALGGMLLAQRTGPEQVYWGILHRAPEPPAGYPQESPKRTARRVVAPALTLALLLLVISPVLIASVLLLGGRSREDALQHIPAASVAVGATWTLVCGAAALRMAHYFSRWEGRNAKVALCLPLRAGAMRHVYYAEDARPES